MSPEPEFSQPIVEETVASRMSLDDTLMHLPATAKKILSAAEKLSGDLTELPTHLCAQRLSALIDDLVWDLVPLMASAELVLCPDIDLHLADALRKDHSEVRLLIERLSMLADGLERRIGSRPAPGPMRSALRQMASALGDLLADQLDTLRLVDRTLAPDDRARLTARLDAAIMDARERTMLIVLPEMAPTASTVLRHRPDLNAAHAMSLAEYDRRSRRGGPPAKETQPTQDQPTGNHGGR